MTLDTVKDWSVLGKEIECEVKEGTVREYLRGVGRGGGAGDNSGRSSK